MAARTATIATMRTAAKATTQGVAAETRPALDHITMPMARSAAAEVAQWATRLATITVQPVESVVLVARPKGAIVVVAIDSTIAMPPRMRPKSTMSATFRHSDRPSLPR